VWVRERERERERETKREKESEREKECVCVCSQIGLRPACPCKGEKKRVSVMDVNMRTQHGATHCNTLQRTAAHCNV